MREASLLSGSATMQRESCCIPEIVIARLDGKTTAANVTRQHCNVSVDRPRAC